MNKPAISILLKPNNISWHAITELLHLAYAEHAKNGLKYSACSQSEEHTRERVGDGLCVVAILEGKLVGTATVHLRRKVVHLCQFAVHPKYRSYGIGKKLEEYLFNLAIENGKEALVCDTSEKADRIVHWYLKNGWQKVGMVSHPTTNFYSICFRKPVCGYKYSWLKSFLLFTYSSCYCKLKLSEYGKRRWYVRLIDSILNRL